MASTWGPVQKQAQAARERAVRALIAMYPSDYLMVMDKERAALGLPPLAPAARRPYEPDCGVYNHPRDCECDLG